jgi:hypothetical protein
LFNANDAALEVKANATGAVQILQHERELLTGRRIEVGVKEDAACGDVPNESDVFRPVTAT